jgi:hypothetical protein
MNVNEIANMDFLLFNAGIWPKSSWLLHLSPRRVEAAEMEPKRSWLLLTERCLDESHLRK